MSELINQLFQQYSTYSNVDISLEVFAVIFGFISVWYSKNNNVLVFPTGLINTSIFVYLLFKWELLGDMLINAYYFIISIYGWYYWTRKSKKQKYTPITFLNSKDNTCISFTPHLQIRIFYVWFYPGTKIPNFSSEGSGMPGWWW